MSGRQISYPSWLAEGKAKFGDDVRKWAFVCPSCKTRITVQEYADAGAPEGAVAFSCIGRYLGKVAKEMGSSPGPCNYTGGGLFKLNPVMITGNGDPFSVFEFAEK